MTPRTPPRLLTLDEAVERLADWDHSAWAGWTAHMLDRLTPENIARWRRQIATPYAQLSEAEKESDRKEARQILAVLDYDALAAALAEAQQTVEELRDWRAKVTVSLHEEGGTFYADVSKKVSELALNLAEAERAREAAQHSLEQFQQERDQLRSAVIAYEAENARLKEEAMTCRCTEGLTALSQENARLRAALPLTEHLQRQRDFSEKTFGPGQRTSGVVDHIRKELREIEEHPNDLSEWIDVVILGFDGAWRAGYTPEQITAALVAKQTKNESRAWPDWRISDPSKAIEHVRSGAAVRGSRGTDEPAD